MEVHYLGKLAEIRKTFKTNNIRMKKAKQKLVDKIEKENEKLIADFEVQKVKYIKAVEEKRNKTKGSTSINPKS